MLHLGALLHIQSLFAARSPRLHEIDARPIVETAHVEAPSARRPKFSDLVRRADLSTIRLSWKTRGGVKPEMRNTATQYSPSNITRNVKVLLSGMLNVGPAMHSASGATLDMDMDPGGWV